MLGHDQISEPNLSKYIIDAPMLNYIIIKHTQLTLGTKYRYYTQSTGKVPNIVPKSKVLNLLSDYRIIIPVDVLNLVSNRTKVPIERRSTRFEQTGRRERRVSALSLTE